jgi:hypothetical protein
MSGKTHVDHSGEMAYQFQLLPDKSVGQMGGYGSGIVRVFVRQLVKRAQSNAVVHSQKEMDRVGFEPTTSATLKDTISRLKCRSWSIA